MQDTPPDLSAYRNNPKRDSRRQALHRAGHLFRDRYKVIKVLAAGGFGVTYLAQDGAIPGSPLCVIKQLCPKVRNQMALERAKRRFRQEARVLSKVGSHSQIPRLLDYFTVNEEFYLVQEYVPGEVLTKEVRRLGCQSEAQVRRFLLELLPVIKFVHRCRIIHRDIKPPNIIRCRDDGRLVLIDFGAVRECLADLDVAGYQNPLTQFVGTPGFAPPEQRAMRPTFASDIYALGMTCLFLLTGKTPLEFDSAPATGDILWRHLVEVSDGFARLLDKMLKQDHSDRYQNVDDILRTLALEPYETTFAQGLSHQRRPQASPQDGVTPDEGYLTPVQRQALSIRRWRSHQRSPQPRTGFSMTTSNVSPEP
ncbi:serine/threonine-protein kinase [Leptolyngbya sp. PCC 6406]|uniref:serine/threonine-protein kinase n=1 Tax=Leptolyngbya sp. PCC 6406 TaxID=1173264 RepID=UPI0002ACC232|nr:serine/threonine-protein kinase [Leptolyngbya sp. PCC 6406]